MRCAVAVLGVLFAAPRFATAQNEHCDTFEQMISEDRTSTVPQLRFSALQEARNRLIASLSVEIRGTTQIDKSNAGGGKTETRMMQGITQETRGWITSDSILGWKALGDGRTYSLHYHGCARNSVGERDAAFFANVSLNKVPPSYVDNGPRQRDSIVVSVQVTQPAYVTVFHRSEDDLEVLYPSVSLGSRRREQLGSNGQVRVPKANRMVASLVDGQRRATDWIVVVITKDDIPLPRPPESVELGELQEFKWVEYGRWLNSIPAQRRYVVELPFSIERTNP